MMVPDRNRPPLVAYRLDGKAIGSCSVDRFEKGESGYARIQIGLLEFHCDLGGSWGDQQLQWSVGRLRNPPLVFGWLIYQRLERRRR
jgi:hypothetical protein